MSPPRLRRRRLRDWLHRYLPAELSGTASALLAAQLALMTTQSLVAAALCGSVGETAGYYAAAIARDIAAHHRLHRRHTGHARFWLTSFTCLRSLLIEFGPAEAVDSVFVRPYLLWISPQLLGQVQLGWLTAKLGADTVFYTLAIAGHNFHRRFFAGPLRLEHTEAAGGRGDGTAGGKGGGTAGGKGGGTAATPGQAAPSQPPSWLHAGEGAGQR